MKYKQFYRCLSAFFMISASSYAQVNLSFSAGRVVGHAQLTLTTVSPNLVEGREFNAPQGIAVDTGVNPPILYVSDTGNNRVLAWKNAAQFANGAPADLVIGQNDKFTTSPKGPGTPSSVGLSNPTGLAVNKSNLYVVDSGNNRVLRFPSPFAQGDKLPDLVIGQPGFNANASNGGGAISGSTVYLSGGGVASRASMVFDVSGNLYLADVGNRRVLRYPSSVLIEGNNGPAADLVLGQPDFTTVNSGLSPFTSGSQLSKNQFALPHGLTVDSAGRLYVSDSDPNRPDLLSRVLVFAPPLRSGMAAARIMGVAGQVQGQVTPQSTIDKTVVIDPEGVLVVDGHPAVVDSHNSRILLFDSFEKWPAETSALPSPQATAVIGQPDGFSARLPNRGHAEASQFTLALPMAAAWAGREVFVADTGNHRVLVFPQQSVSPPAALRVLGQNGFEFNTVNLIEGREFDFVTQSAQGIRADAGIAIDQRSNPPHLYVSDPYNHRILGFSDFRTVKPGTQADLVIGQPDMYRSVCNYPSGDPNKPSQSSLCQPIGVTVDASGNLWVADSGNGRVLRFPQPFAKAAVLPLADLVLGQGSFTEKIADPTAHTMAAPYGLAIVDSGGVLVSDVSSHRVLFFSNAGTGFTSGMAASMVLGQPDFTSSVAASSKTPEQNRMNSPHHIASDSKNRVYVADSGSGRVLIFDAIENLPATHANAAVTLQGQFSNPYGIYVNPQSGEIWVSDAGRSQSVRFPSFDNLVLNNTPSAVIPAADAPIALAQDQFGDLYVADAANRVAIYYPGLTAVNAANFLPDRPLAPGAVASAFPAGNQFGSGTGSYSDLPKPLPLPTQLADTQVFVDGQPAPLYFVSPSEINFLVPMNTPATGTVELLITRSSSGQVLAMGPVNMNSVSPGLFTTSNTGSGEVVAVNHASSSKNSKSNPAPRGSVISLYGTGAGVIPGAPPDGSAPGTAVPTAQKPQVIIGTRFVGDSDVQYSGLAVGSVGVWQIDVRIPESVAPGDAVIVAVVYDSVPSIESQNIVTTIAVSQ